MKTRFIAVLLFCSFVTDVCAQTEYFGIIHPVGAEYIKLDSIPGIKWISNIPEFSTFDSENKRYFFRGADQEFNVYFITLDAVTGEVLHQVPYPLFNNQASNLVELRYCESDNKIYGLHWNADLAQEFLATLDETTGEVTVIAEIPDVEYVGIGLTAFDQVNNRYIFTGIANDETRIYTLDTSGNVLYSPLAPGGTGIGSYGYFFNSEEELIYCMYWTDNGEARFLATIDNLDAEVTILMPLEGCEGVGFGQAAYCESTNAYTFAGLTDDGELALFAADLNTETFFVADYWLPESLSEGDNVIEFEYDQNSGELYALHWEVNTPISNVVDPSAKEILIYPNPANDKVFIQVMMPRGNLIARIFDMSGQLVIETKLTYAIHTMDISSLSSGVYQLEIMDESNFRMTQKIRVN